MRIIEWSGEDVRVGLLQMSWWVEVEVEEVGGGASEMTSVLSHPSNSTPTQVNQPLVAERGL